MNMDIHWPEAATRTLPWCTARLHRLGESSHGEDSEGSTIRLEGSVFCLFVHLSIYLYLQIHIYIYINIYIYYSEVKTHPSTKYVLGFTLQIFFGCTSGSRLDVPCPWPPCCVTASLPPRTLAEVRDGRGWMSLGYAYSHPGIHRTWNFQKTSLKS
jgi:hypothetical protein